MVPHPSVRRRLIGAIAILCVWSVTPTGCEKKPAPPKKAKEADTAETSRLSHSASSQPRDELPSATRFNLSPEVFESAMPDLPDNPDVPKPNFPGIAGYSKNEVIAVYTEALKAPDDPEKIGALGMVFYRLNSASEAIHCFERAVKLAPKEFRWQYYLSLAYGIAFETQKAVDVMKQAARLNPDYPAVTTRLGDLYRDLDVSLARTYYEEALQKLPTDCRIHYGLAMCALKEKREQDAIRHLERAVEIAPKFADANRSLARLYEQRGDKVKADAHAALADQGGLPPVVRDPLYIDLVARVTGPEPLMSITKQLLETAQADLAKSILARALRWNPTAWELHQQYAMVLLQQAAYQEAIDEFQLVIQNDPGRHYVRQFMAQALTEMGRLKEADSHLREEMKRRPDDPDPYGRYADFLLNAGHAREAEEMFQRMVRAEPGRPINELGLIASQICLKKYDLAIDRFRRIQSQVREGVDLTAALVSQLLVLISEQARTDAEQFRRRTIELDDVIAFGMKLKAAGMDAAGHKFENCLDTIARNTVELGRRKDFKPAVRMIQKTISLDRGGVLRDAFCAIYLSMYKHDRGVSENLLAQYARHIEEAPELALVVSWIRSTCTEAAVRDGEAAVKLAQWYAEKRPGAEAFDALAAALAEANRFEEAVQAQEKAMAAPSESDRAQQMRSGPFGKRLALYRDRKPYRCER